MAPERKAILVIDDNPQLADVLVELLELSGFDARASNNALAAIEDYRARGADLVLVDFGMPDLDGAEIVREITRIDPGTQCCIMTGFGVSYAHEHARCPIACDVITKPFDVEEVLQRL